METPMTTAAESSSLHQPTLRNYAIVTTLLGTYVALLVTVSGWRSALEKESLLAPMGAMFALTGVVLFITAGVRNYAAITKQASTHYYLTYDNAARPPDWIERPARTFNNLMQAPTLFYIGCLLMMVVQRVDQGAFSLAWVYVATRAVHALLYIAWNPLAYRFGSYIASWICLCTLWARFIL
jgi:hypothetical protein